MLIRTLENHFLCEVGLDFQNHVFDPDAFSDNWHVCVPLLVADTLWYCL